MNRPRLQALIGRLRMPVIAGALLMTHAAAWAQQQAPAAPQPNLQKSPPVWLGLLVIFLMLVAVITVSLMPSRRGHQD